MQNIQQSMRAFYRETASKRGNGGWRAVGAKIGKNGAYARQLANGDKRIPDDIAIAWMDAMGMEPAPARQRRRSCRLCLPVTLTPEQRAQVRAYALELAGHAPALEVV